MNMTLNKNKHKALAALGRRKIRGACVIGVIGIKLKLLLLFLINIYQRWVSPNKGFTCAHRAYFGRSTCSAYGKRAVYKYGALTGVTLIFRRFKSCSVALKKLEKENPKDENPKKKRDEDIGKCLVLEGIGEVACCSALSIFG